MASSMHRYMKVGLIQFMAYPDAVHDEEALLASVRSIALDPFFQAIEVTAMPSQQARRAVRKMVETARLDLAFGAQPMLLSSGLNINDLHEPRRREAVQLLKTGLDQAAELGASSFAFLSGPYPPDGIDQAMAALVRSTQELCAYARGLGPIQVALEVFDHTVDKKSLIGPVQLAKAYAEQMADCADRFGLLVDLSHLPLLGESPHQAIVPVAEHIIHAHMGNCVIKDPALPAYGDLHPRFGFPDSENDVAQLTDYLAVLLGVGFLNPDRPPVVSFEVKPFGDEDPDLVVANAKRTLINAWDRLWTDH